MNEGALPPDDFSYDIERIVEIADYDLETPADLAERVSTSTAQLLLAPTVAEEAAAALSVGHLILQGPPGTGKSSLARALCHAFSCGFLPVTAHEDWSVFDVIGRQELRVDPEGLEEIIPVNGFFTDASIACAGAVVKHFDDPSEPQAVWLLIDELNRAHIDRAFGELFTVLGSDEPVEIVLPHQRDGNRVMVTPRRFRIIATLNNFDRQFVNELSEALRRRFTFINVDIPAKRSQGSSWSDQLSEELAIREFRAVVERAAARVQRRIVSMGEVAVLSAELASAATTALEGLFNLVEQVRYAERESNVPHLPIGTAQLIDTAELLLARARQTDADTSAIPDLLDWAAAIKLAPLFDTATVNHAQLIQFAESLPAPFSGRFSRELRQLVAAGSYYVE